MNKENEGSSARLQVISCSYFFAGFLLFPLAFLGTVLASNFVLSIFYLTVCLSQTIPAGSVSFTNLKNAK